MDEFLSRLQSCSLVYPQDFVVVGRDFSMKEALL